jgi:hypothetical protein
MGTSTTDFSNGQTETDKTGESDTVDNNEFMRALFGKPDADVRPMVVSFAGNPTSVKGSAWAGNPWDADGTALSSLNNNYFSLASFRPDEAGRWRRRKSHFSALNTIMLDDLGGKIPMERLTLKPTWLIETSPGNYQAGYALREPLSDGSAGDRLMNAIVAASLCDPGANGPRARLARLPVAVNGKHEPPFHCSLETWNPGLRYLVDEIVSGLQLDMVEPGRPRRRAPQTQVVHSESDDTICIPRPDDNAIVQSLRERQLYKAPLGDGKHNISCPWVSEHTGHVDNGTAYFEPDDNWPIGGFKCLHGHCADRHIRDLLHFVDVEVNAARMKSTIRVRAGEIHRVVDAAERELAVSRRHYQRGGLITTVVTDPGTRETRVQEISQPALVRALAGAATWEKFDGRAKDWVRTDPPARHAMVLFDSTIYNHLPVLNGLTRQPYLRPDGSLTTSDGYDAATGMFGVFDAREFAVPDSPSRAEAESALRGLEELLGEFSFAGNTDKAAALCAILTAAVRPSLPRAPMFHARAHVVGSGKSYLCELVTAFATPQRGTPTTFPGDDEECRKLLLAELLRAPAVIEFDNLTGNLVAHKSLCTALTSEHMSGRILGVSKTATVNTRALFLSSGNNVGPVQDMTRRCITIDLDPRCEVPAARSFKRPDLVSDVLRERGRYISDALTIVRAWIAAGKPRAECKSFAGFGEWSDLCRQPLLWLDLADPVNSVFDAIADDPERETLAQFLEEWFSVFGREPAMVRDAVRHATSNCGANVELSEILQDIAGERGDINRRKLGWWMRRHEGRIIDNKKIVRGSGSGSSKHWRIKVVESVSPVS